MRYLLVDRIDRVEAGRLVSGWKNVAMSEDYLEWHFPDRPILPGSLVLEAFSQLAGWLEASTSGFASWILVDRVTSVRVFGFAVPGDRLDLEVEVLPGSDPARRVYRGESKVGGERRSLVEFEGVVVPLADLEDAARAERTFRSLKGETISKNGRRGHA